MSRAKHCVHLLNWAFEAKADGVGEALEALRQSGYCRLRPIEPKALHPLAGFVAAYHLGDPVGPRDSWRPWKREKAVAEETRLAAHPKTPPRQVGRSATAP